MLIDFQGRTVFIHYYGYLHGAARHVIQEWDGGGWGRYYSTKGNWVKGVRNARRWATYSEVENFVKNGDQPKRTYAEVCAANIDGWN